jgi:hypothetical protein
MWPARTGICTEEIYYLQNYVNSSASCTVMNGRKISGQEDGKDAEGSGKGII